MNMHEYARICVRARVHVSMHACACMREGGGTPPPQSPASGHGTPAGSGAACDRLGCQHGRRQGTSWLWADPCGRHGTGPAFDVCVPPIHACTSVRLSALRHCARTRKITWQATDPESWQLRASHQNCGKCATPATATMRKQQQRQSMLEQRLQQAMLFCPMTRINQLTNVTALAAIKQFQDSFRQ